MFTEDQIREAGRFHSRNAEFQRGWERGWTDASRVAGDELAMLKADIQRLVDDLQEKIDRDEGRYGLEQIRHMNWMHQSKLKELLK